MVYTRIDHKNGVKMFRNQVEPQATAPFFTITLAIFNVHFLRIFSRAKAREKKALSLRYFHFREALPCTVSDIAGN